MTLGLVVLLPALAAAAPTRVALVPLSSLTDEGTSLAGVEKTLAAGLATIKEVDLVRPDAVRNALKRAKRRDLEGCEGEPQCLQEIGQLVGAEVVVFGVAGGLAEGQVVYLKSVEVKTGQETGSTTATFSGPEPGRVVEARAAAVRLVAPASYLGTLILKVDVEGADVVVDGKIVGKSPIAPIAASVGTHALRVTHPRYRDFVRFVTVPFDKAETLPVALKEFPIVADDMRGRPVPEEERPWYQSGWAVAGFAAVVVVVTTIVAASIPRSPQRDKDVTVHPPR
ncbi:MAG TPA: PEGA domain-containing protein [Haliangiales bacterium]|nr:PEGA domain-containing protein [Haliangiales bacterium]